ncbi:unnamed protein product [Merluccius merluccius]
MMATPGSPEPKQGAGMLGGLFLWPSPLCSVLFYTLLSCSLVSASLPGLEYDYGISPKFVCTPIPPEADPSCYSPPSVPHGGGGGGGGGAGGHGGGRGRSQAATTAAAAGP